MKRRVFAICSVLIATIVLVAMVPGCDGGACIGEIEVKATLCDTPWEGNVTYTLAGPGATAAPLTGTSVTALFDNVECGNWTCEYVSGGPPGAYFVDITPSPTQEVTSGAVITFTLNFELDQDASIEFLYWTINGEPVEAESDHEVFRGDIIDVHYAQHVDGCEGREVVVNETSELWIHYADFEAPGEPGEVGVHVLNDGCAVVKAPEPEKLSQRASVNGEPVEYCMEFPIPYDEVVTLDVETIWQLEKCTNYTKTINWLHIEECIEPPCCALFELELLGDWNWGYYFILESCATVELVDDVDVNPENNTACSPPIAIYYWEPVPI